MATVKNYLPSRKLHNICNKGADHEGQALNMVCLDALCRSHPLICATCFTQTHKYHKVASLDKFINDYRHNINEVDYKMQSRKINKHYTEMKNLVKKFSESVMKKIKNFEKSLQQYAAHLSGHSYIRDEVGKQLQIELDPDRILKQPNKNVLENSLSFILNNCLYDSNLNMINVSNILKQNQERVSAMLDKMVYMTEFCEATINKAFDTFDFASITLKQQKSVLNQHIQKLNSHHDDPFSVKKFIDKKESLAKIIQQRSNLILEQSQNVGAMNQWEETNNLAHCEPLYRFGKNKHDNITVINDGDIVKSDCTAASYHYAMAWPNLNNEPQKIKEWSMKILKCRDFASKNTMALGIGRLSDLKLAKFQGSPTNNLLVSSQGYVIMNGNYQKTDFVYRQGDVIHFSYDPYYGLLEVSKDNGRKLCLKSINCCEDEPLYLCARLTYASDQVQLIS